MAYITKLDLTIKNYKLINIMKFVTFLVVLGITLSLSSCALEYTQEEMDNAMDLKNAQYIFYK